MIGAVQSGGGMPPIDPNYPLPQSGDYLFGPVGLSTVTYSIAGTPYDPGGNVASVTDAVGSMRRSKYTGTWTPSPGAGPSNWNMNWFNTFPFIAATNDAVVSFGTQIDIEPNTNFSLEWRGYLLAPATDTYNTYLSCDDDAVFWIGSAALNPTNSNYQNFQSNESPPQGRGTNGIQLTGGQFYPVRIWFSEFTGACKMQLFMISSSGTKYSGAELGWEYCGSTGGYNP